MMTESTATQCRHAANSRTRVQHKTTERIGYLSSRYRGMDSLYTEVTWLDSRMWTQEATRHLTVIGTDRWCRTHGDWEPEHAEQAGA